MKTLILVLMLSGALAQDVAVPAGLPGLGLDPIEAVPACTIIDPATWTTETVLADAKLMGQAIGFWVAQTESLRAIRAAFPDLAAPALAAQVQFHQAFGPSLQQIAALVTARTNGGMAAARQRILQEADAALASNNPIARAGAAWRRPEGLTRAQATEFIALVERRALGAIDDHTRLAFCRFHPTLLATPLAALSPPYRRLWDSVAHPALPAIRVQLPCPGGWRIDEPTDAILILHAPLPPAGTPRTTITLHVRPIGPEPTPAAVRAHLTELVPAQATVTGDTDLTWDIQDPPRAGVILSRISHEHLIILALTLAGGIGDGNQAATALPTLLPVVTAMHSQLQVR